MVKKAHESTEEVILTDKLGQRIVPGSIIVYGHVMGRSGGLRIGKVLKVDRKPEQKYNYSPLERLTVQGIDAEWQDRKPELLSKKSTLMFPDRTVVIDPAMLPANLKELLDGVER